MDQNIRCIDTHCHLDIVESEGGSILEALGKARARGVAAVVQIATDLAGAKRNHALSLEYRARKDVPAIFWTGGLHPENAPLDDTDGIVEYLRAHSSDAGFVGVGETGLDYYHDATTAPRQKEHFARHLDLALELDRPVIVHLRDDRVLFRETQTITDALELVKDRKGIKGVLHCYTYGPEEAKAFIDLGWFVSFSGIVTYKTAQAIQAAALSCPLESMLVETDAPFLAPVPHRGKRNEPAFVVDTLEFISKLRADKLGEDPRAVERAIYLNSHRFLGLEIQA